MSFTARSDRSAPPPQEKRPLEALENHGVEYIEVRCVDLNPLLPNGIDKPTSQFLDTFLLFCLLKDSPLTNNDEYRQITENQRRAVARGRDPELELLDGDKQRNLVEWGLSLMAEIQPVAEMLDQANSTAEYSTTAELMKTRLQDNSLTPAAQLIAEMTANNETYYGMAMRKAQEHRQYFKSKALNSETAEKYRRLAEESQLKQKQIEASDSLTFDQFIADYYQ